MSEPQCVKCGSERMLTDGTVRGFSHVVVHFPWLPGRRGWADGIDSPLEASVCVDCGNVEIVAASRGILERLWTRREAARDQ